MNDYEKHLKQKSFQYNRSNRFMRNLLNLGCTALTGRLRIDAIKGDLTYYQIGSMGINDIRKIWKNNRDKKAWKNKSNIRNLSERWCDKRSFSAKFRDPIKF